MQFACGIRSFYILIFDGVVVCPTYLERSGTGRARLKAGGDFGQFQSVSHNPLTRRTRNWAIRSAFSDNHAVPVYVTVRLFKDSERKPQMSGMNADSYEIQLKFYTPYKSGVSPRLWRNNLGTPNFALRFRSAELQFRFAFEHPMNP